MTQVARLFDDFSRRHHGGPGAVTSNSLSQEEPGRFADQVASYLPVPTEQKQKVLDAAAVPERLRRVKSLLAGRGREAEPRPAPQQRGREADREDPEGVLPQREDEAHQEGARAGGQHQRDRGAARAHREVGHEPDGEGEGHLRAQAPRAHAPRLRRGHRLPLLHRLAPGAALVQGEQGQARHRPGPEGPGRGPLRAGEGQGAHPGVPLREAARQGAQGVHPLLRPGPPAWARPPWPSPSPGAWGASSSG